jgi:quercetin dioxygenase-like cupin family protein
MKYVEKIWGFERWIVNNSQYCGKLLFFKPEKSCSWHYHKLKDETFYLQSGKLLIKYSYQDDISQADEKILLRGESFHIPIGLRHKMIALEASELFEFSTEHFDSDSYRLVES